MGDVDVMPSGRCIAALARVETELRDVATVLRELDAPNAARQVGTAADEVKVLREHAAARAEGVHGRLIAEAKP